MIRVAHGIHRRCGRWPVRGILAVAVVAAVIGLILLGARVAWQAHPPYLRGHLRLQLPTLPDAITQTLHADPPAGPAGDYWAAVRARIARQRRDAVKVAATQARRAVSQDPWE